MRKQRYNKMNKAKHIAIILDGNRTYAQKLQKKPWEGHSLGLKTLKVFLDQVKELEMEELTLYAFSVQNFERPKIEVDYLLKLFEQELANELGKDFENLEKNQVKVKFLGRIQLFPESLQKKMRELEQKTKDFNKFKLNLAMAYGGKEELIDSFKAIYDKIVSGKIKKQDINEKLISDHLYINSEPDMIIRTANKKRTSNFLIWQSTYSEWFFLEKTWPEFTIEDLKQCIKEFSTRKRTFGK